MSGSACAHCAANIVPLAPARVDFSFAGKPVGRPRIYRDRPQMNSPHAMALATALAAELDGQRVI